MRAFFCVSFNIFDRFSSLLLVPKTLMHQSIQRLHFANRGLVEEISVGALSQETNKLQTLSPPSI